MHSADLTTRRQFYECLVEKAKELSSGALGAGLLVGHDTVGGREDDDTELTRRKETGGPALDLGHGAVKARGDNTALVDAADKVDNDLASTVVVHNLKVTNVLLLLHNGQKLHEDLGARADEHLALSTLLGVVDGLQSIGEHGHFSHGC